MEKLVKLSDVIEAIKTSPYIHSADGVINLMGHIQALPTTTDEWVKCSERLPEKEGMVVIAFSKNGIIQQGYFHHEIWFHSMLTNQNVVVSGVGITHWMPLPNKPN